LRDTIFISHPRRSAGDGQRYGLAAASIDFHDSRHKGARVFALWAECDDGRGGREDAGGVRGGAVTVPPGSPACIGTARIGTARVSERFRPGSPQVSAC
jgi:hypothetical protein